MDKKLKKKIDKKIKKVLSKSFPKYEINPDSTLLKFTCNSCNSDYEFDVMAIYFDKLYNKEKFLVEPKCTFCGENRRYKLRGESMNLLSYLYNNNLLKDSLFEERYIKELTEKYPKEKKLDSRGLDDKGLQALEQGHYEEVLRIFTQFIYLNQNHHLGFEFIAYAYYEIREFEKSIKFMEYTMERAKNSVENGFLDKGLYSVLEKNYEYMKRKQLIIRWWENL